MQPITSGLSRAKGGHPLPKPAPQPQLGIKRRLPAFVCDKSWSEESGEEEWTGYDAAKDVIAQERRSLEVCVCVLCVCVWSEQEDPLCLGL